MFKYQTKSNWITYNHHQSPNLSLSISANCIYNLQSHTYGYTFVTFGLLPMCSFNFDSFNNSKSPLNFNVRI